ncbi:hypothetical protein HCG82_10320 [Enterococcus faecium]|uniref:hypothetical protein n=1 Tax=Enterococcus TaxID=1350 RepID=UPI001C8BE80F|nr:MULTISPECIES: hypothetical protein [Enterococcus]MBX9119743.1 hypothetical protein [Enterococcus faecium]MBX9128084.1 hypothetical protein [Enterococcus casseliflavus]
MTSKYEFNLKESRILEINMSTDKEVDTDEFENTNMRIYLGHDENIIRIDLEIDMTLKFQEPLTLSFKAATFTEVINNNNSISMDQIIDKEHKTLIIPSLYKNSIIISQLVENATGLPFLVDLTQRFNIDEQSNLQK